MKVYTVVMARENKRIIADRYTHKDICDVIRENKRKGFKKVGSIILTEVTNEYEVLLKEKVFL